MPARRRLRLLLIAALAALLSAALAASAQAATVRANVTIQGAGTVTGQATCTNTSQRGSDMATCAQQVLSNDPSLSGVTMTLTAIPSSFPAGQWHFVRWEGCESVSAATCSISAPVLSARTWDVRAVFQDTTSPTFVAAPSEGYSATAERTVSLSWSTNEPTTATCRLDGGTSTTCNPGVTYGALAEGDHYVDVRVTDGSGNPTTATRTFKVIDTAITGGPAAGAVTDQRSATFTYGSVAGTSYRCSLDGAAFSACPSTGQSYASLADGTHAFAVEALDGGYFDHVAATRTWTVHATPPTPSPSPTPTPAPTPTLDPSPSSAPSPGPAPSPTPTPATRLVVTLHYAARPGASTTRFTKLSISVPAGSSLRVSCRGAGCPKGLRGAGWARRSASGTVNLEKLVRTARLHRGARLTFTVTRPGSTGATRTLTVRSRRAPRAS